MLRIVKESRDGGPCGGCGGSLPTFQVWQGLRFDDFHELPDEVRSGTINFLPCPHCGYRAWLWPGFVCFDAKRKRSVLLTYSHDYLDNAATFSRVVASLKVADPGFADLDPTRPFVEVSHYEHLLGVLAHDDELFNLEAAYWQGFRERCGIEDLQMRARRALDLTETVPLITLSGLERKAPFISALLSEARHRLETRIPGSVAHQVATAWVEAVNNYRLAVANNDVEAEPETKGDVDADDDGGSDSGAVVTPANWRVPDELRTILQSLIEAIEPRLNQGPSGAPHWTAFARLLHAIRETRDYSQPVLLNALPEEVQRPVEVLSEWLRTLRVHDEDSVVAGPEVVRRAALGEVKFQGALFETIVLETGKRESAAQLMAGIELFTELAYRCRRLESTLFAGFLIGLLEKQFGGDRQIEHAAYATPVVALAVEPAKGRTVTLHPGSFAAFGIATQNLARHLGPLGFQHAAALSAGISAFFFTRAGRQDGALKSRTDAAEYLMREGMLQDDALSALVDELQTYDRDPANTAGPSIDLGRALLLRAELQFRDTQGRVLYLQSSLEAKEGGSTGDEPKILIPGDGRVFGRRLPREDGIGRAEAEADESLRPEDDQGGSDQSTTLVMYSTLARPGRASVVVMAHIQADWFRTLGKVLDVGDRGVPEMVISAYSLLIEFVRRFDCPGLARYFVRAVRAEYYDRNLEAPAQVRFTLALADAHALLSDARHAGIMLTAEQLDAGPVLHELDAALQAIDLAPGAIQGVDPIGALIATAEVTEAIGQYEKAATGYVQAALVTLESDESYTPHSAERAVGPVYRTVRALAKAEMACPRDGRAGRCIELAEFVKSRSQRLVVDRNRRARKRLAEREEPWAPILADLPVDLESLRSLCPEGSALLFYSLMQRTELNEGFWLSALILPMELGAPRLRCTPLDDVYSAQQKVADEFRRAEALVFGHRLEDVPARLEQSQASLNAALEDLAEILIPPDVVAELERRAVTRMFITPEAYLFDTPWAALPVSTSNGRKPLCALAGGVAVNILPSLGVLARRRRVPNVRGPKLQSAGAMFVPEAPWRPDLAPLTAIRKRLTEAINEAARSTHALDDLTWIPADVPSFIGMLRECRISVFFGHGEVSEHGSRLILSDGSVEGRTVESASNVAPLASDLSLIMACSGINSVSRKHVREISGIHMEMIRGGVRCVVGSARPLIPIVAIKVLETVLPLIVQGEEIDDAVERARTAIRASPNLKHPLFWAHLACFGDGSKRLASLEADDAPKSDN